MNTIRENHIFDTDFSLLFIANEMGNGSTSFINVEERDFNSNQKTYSHFHDCFEIVYVHHGEGIFLIESQLYPMRQGDVFLIRSDMIHHPSPDDKRGYECSVIIFKPELIKENAILELLVKECFETSMPLVQINQPIMQVQFENCMNYLGAEINSKFPMYEQSCLACLTQILIIIKRQQTAIVQTNTHQAVGLKSQIWMTGILQYLDEHYLTDSISLQELSAQALVSPEHFSRIFKKMTGMTLPMYINLKKLHYAKQLLASTNQSIQHISEKSGFNDVSYFTKKFKEIWGCQPSDIRR